MSKEKELLNSISNTIGEIVDKEETLSFLVESVDFLCENKDRKKNNLAMNLIKKFVLQSITRSGDKRRQVYILICKLIDMKSPGKSTNFVEYMDEIEYTLNGYNKSFWIKTDS